MQGLEFIVPSGVVQSGFYWGDFLFRGISSINLDDKSRLAIPTRQREMLRNCAEGQLIVTVAVNDRCADEKSCLWLYPLPKMGKT